MGKNDMAEQVSINKKAMPRQAAKRSLRFKLLSLIAGGLIILASATYGVIVLYNHFHEAPQQNNTDQSKKGIDLSKFTPEQKAQYYLLQHDYASATRIYQSELKGTSDKNRRVLLYNSLASTAYSQKDYANALEYQMKVDELSPTSSSAESIGDIGLLLGDNRLASEYYSKALSRLDTKSPTYGYVANKIQAKLDGVK